MLKGRFRGKLAEPRVTEDDLKSHLYVGVFQESIQRLRANAGHQSLRKSAYRELTESVLGLVGLAQVTIPQELRNRMGLLPYTEVEFELAGDYARIRKAQPQPGKGRWRMAVEVLRGTATSGLSTNEIMALTRGEPPGRKKRK